MEILRMGLVLSCIVAKFATNSPPVHTVQMCSATWRLLCGPMMFKSTMSRELECLLRRNRLAVISHNLLFGRAYVSLTLTNSFLVVYAWFSSKITSRTIPLVYSFWHAVIPKFWFEKAEGETPTIMLEPWRHSRLPYRSITALSA